MPGLFNSRMSSYMNPRQAISPATGSLGHAANMAPEQLREAVDRLIARDGVRINNATYPAYRGNSLADTSSLTQRARELSNQWGSRPAPMQNKLQQVISRPAVGFNAEAINTQLGNLRNSSANFTNNKLGRALQKNFGEVYQPFNQRFADKTTKDRERNLLEARGNYDNLSRRAANLDRQRNEQTTDVFNNLAADKVNRRASLVNNLNQFGSQEHAYNNFNLGAERNAFDMEVNAPEARLELLKNARNSLASVTSEDAHPDAGKIEANNTLRALRAYGIDPTLPAEQWEDNRVQTPIFSGEKIAPLPDKVLQSQNMLERLSGNLQDNYSQERKNLTRNLLNRESIADGAFELPESARASMSLLESEAKKRLKSDLASLNNQYIQLGQYGSEQHLAAANRRAREIARSTDEQRGMLSTENIQHNIANNYNDEASNISRLRSLGALGQNEFNNVISNIRDTNAQGAEEWRNNQAANESAYADWRRENNWNWPSNLRGAAGDSFGNIYRGLSPRNLHLDSLASANTRHSEANLAPRSLPQDITTEPEYWRARENYASGAGREANLRNQRPRITEASGAFDSNRNMLSSRVNLPPISASAPAAAPAASANFSPFEDYETNFRNRIIAEHDRLRSEFPSLPSLHPNDDDAARNAFGPLARAVPGQLANLQNNWRSYLENAFNERHSEIQRRRNSSNHPGYELTPADMITQLGREGLISNLGDMLSMATWQRQNNRLRPMGIR